MRRFLPVLLFALVAAACSAGQVPNLPDPTTRAPIAEPPTTTGTPTTTEPPVVPAELAGFDVRSISIEDGELTYLLTVAVADSSAERAQGLMGLADLGDLDGMLFIYPSPTVSTFWMKDTLIPLDIAFFDSEGRWVNNLSMQPCTDEVCETYSADGGYTFAVEVPDAGFATLTPAAVLNPEL